MSETEVLNFFDYSGETVSCAVFLSGSGTNAEKILEQWKADSDCSYDITCLVTERPLSSRARELSETFAIPLVEHPLKSFYAGHGLESSSLASEKGREVRALWTEALIEKLKPYNVTFGVFAGFVPLCNVTDYFPCLNVHPGDLTVEEDGQRVLVGLHTIPVEEAVFREHESLRTSVIVASAYSEESGEGMDEGIILGISPEVDVDLKGLSLEELKSLQASRPKQRPVGGYADELEDLMDHNLERLKVGGDWVVFPQAVADFAAGKFAYDKTGQLYIRFGKTWKDVKTVVYERNSKEIIFD